MDPRECTVVSDALEYVQRRPEMFFSARLTGRLVVKGDSPSESAWAAMQASGRALAFKL